MPLPEQPQVKSGLLVLVDGVRAYLDTYLGKGMTVFATFNRERFRQINQGHGTANRVVFLFGGDDDDESIGELEGARNKDTAGDPYNPRSLYTWAKRGVVSIWACDTTKTNDELAQIAAIENLFEWTMRAIQETAAKDFTPGRVRVSKDPKEQRYGVELLVDFVHRGPIFDVTLDVVYPTPKVNRGSMSTGDPQPEPE